VAVAVVVVSGRETAGRRRRELELRLGPAMATRRGESGETGWRGTGTGERGMVRARGPSSSS